MRREAPGLRCGSWGINKQHHVQIGSQEWSYLSAVGSAGAPAFQVDHLTTPLFSDLMFE